MAKNLMAKAVASVKSVKAMTAGADEDGYVPFNTRFSAWWEGVDTSVIVARAAELADPAALVIDDENRARNEDAIPAQRILWERLWGEGLHMPGGEDYVLNLAKPCGLDPSKSLVDLGAGLGGGARAIAKQHGIWIAGMEPVREIAEQGMAMSVQKGLAKKVPIEFYSRDNLKLAERKFDCVLAREVFFTIGDKMAALKTVRDALKPKGHFAVTDFVLAEEDSAGPELVAWRETEPYKAMPWSVDRYRKAMSKLNLEVQVFQDVTDDYAGMALAAWRDFSSELDTSILTRELVDIMLIEGEIWQRRIRVLQSGLLRVLRIHAIRREASTMGDW